MAVRELSEQRCDSKKDRSELKGELLSKIEDILAEEKVPNLWARDLQHIQTKPSQSSQEAFAEPLVLEEIDFGSHECKDKSLDQIKKKILRLCTYREQSSVQMRKRFKHEGYTNEIIEQGLLWALENSLINDARYAEVLVRSRLSQGFGIVGIEQDLSSLGFSLEEIPDWPDAFDYSKDEEHLRALEYLKRRPSRSKNQRQACYLKLLKRGYDSQVASRAVTIYLG